MTAWIALTIFVLLKFVSGVELANVSGFHCYTCTATEQDATSSCVLSPSELPNHQKQACPRHICTIVRIEDTSGKIKSFYRGCDWNSPMFANNSCQTEAATQITTCLSSCNTSLCNSGLGGSHGTSGSVSRNYLSNWMVVVAAFVLCLGL